MRAAELAEVPSTLYGPHYRADGRQMHFIRDVIRKIIRGHFRNEPVVWGDGYQSREIVFIDDFVEQLLRASDILDNDILTGEQHTIREFAALVCAIVGYDPAGIQYDTERYVGARSKKLNTTKLRALEPDFAFTPVEVGLARTVERFLTDVHG